MARITLVDTTVTRPPSAGSGPVSYEGPHGPLHGAVDSASTVLRGSALGDITVPWGVEGDAGALARILSQEMAIVVGPVRVRAYSAGAGRSRAARSVTLHAGHNVLLWRTRGLPGLGTLVLERADGAVVATLSAQGRLRVNPAAAAFDVALAVACAVSGICGGTASGGPGQE